MFRANSVELSSARNSFDTLNYVNLSILAAIRTRPQISTTPVVRLRGVP